MPDAIVDTGASWTTIPTAMADDLGLPVIGKQCVNTANGTVEVEHRFARVEYADKVSVADVLVSDGYPGVLLGALTLEGMALADDPKNKRLVDLELLLL
ncbi:MAG: retropepsin-like aspartic protease [Chloroflexota bacterium]